MLVTLLLAMSAPQPVAAVRAKARAPLASYIADGDYPEAALRRNEQGTVGFELDVSPQGRVVQCRVIQSSGSPLIDAATCRVMVSRARFTPARDADGRAVPDTMTSSMRWFLP